MNQKTKKIVIGLCAGALVAAVSVGGTLSYLHTTTEVRANNFTFASNALEAILTEPKWDGVIDYEPFGDGLIPIYDYKEHDGKPDSPVYGYEEGDPDKPIFKPAKDLPRPKKDIDDPEPYGDDSARNMVPGQTALKNPIITNTCNLDEWVAIKISFVYSVDSPNAGQLLSELDYEALTKVIDINYDKYVLSIEDYDPSNPDNEKLWVRPFGDDSLIEQVFYYTKPLEGSDGGTLFKDLNSTIPIFDTVTVDKDASHEDIQRLVDMKGFAIWIQGYAVQREQYKDVEEWLEIPVVFANDVSENKPADVARPGILPGGGVTEVEAA